MRPKSALNLLGPLLKAPSFTSREAAEAKVSASTLAHYVKRGDLNRIGRGVYRATDAPTVRDFRWEDLVAAIQATTNGVICLTSALAVYNLTEDIPRQHWIAIKNSTRHRAAPTTKVIRMRNLDLGRTEIKLSGLTLPIFDRERSIVDAFRYLGLETAIQSLKMALARKGRDRIDPNKMKQYARKLRVPIEPYLLAVTV